MHLKMNRLHIAFIAGILAAAGNMAGPVAYADPIHHPTHEQQPGAQANIPEDGSGQIASPSENREAILMRAKHIKKLIKKNKEWQGGHSPIPHRVITINTFNAVIKEVSRADSAALIALLEDDDYGVRSMSIAVLVCVNPDAESDIEQLIATEPNKEQQSRLRAARTDIRMIKAGGTECKGLM